MRRVEVGRFRVLLDVAREGTCVIDHVRADDGRLSGQISMEPGEVDDLLVALDGVTNDRKPEKGDDLGGAIYRAGQTMLHELYKHGIRFRLEMLVESEVIYRIAHERNLKWHEKGPTLELRIGPVNLVCERGRRVRP